MTELLLWPFVAGLVLTGIHAYFGLHVLARKVVFVDLALAQVAALGLAVAILAGHAVSARPPIGTLLRLRLSARCWWRWCGLMRARCSRKP